MRQSKKYKTVNLQKLLLNAVPAEPVPEAFYTIQAPESFNFPIESTFLQNIKIIEQYYPSEPNQFITESLPSEITKYNDTLLQLKRRNLLIGKNKLSIEGITAFNYNQTYLVAALENKSLDVYGSDLRLIKEIGGFSDKPLRLLHIVPIPVKTFQGLILITSSGSDITVKRIEKSFFSGLTCKYSKDIIKSQSPYVKFVEMPKQLKKKYFSEDPTYKNCTILGCLSCTQITIIRINHAKVTGDGFVDVIYNKTHYNKYNICSASWGEVMINSRDSDMKGVHPAFTYSFGKEFFLLVPMMNSMQINEVVQVKFEWVESFPFKMDKDIIFCQYIKQNEVLLITEDSRIVIFYTGILEFFEREIESKELDLITYEFREKFRSKYVHTGNQTEIQSYNNCFAYDFGSNEIYYLTEEKIGIFVYCNWTEICDILTQQGNYESTMNFLIALYNRANRFDLGFKHTAENFLELSKTIQNIATQYIHTKFGKFNMKTEQELIEGLSNRSTIDEILTPIELLTTTRQYTFLFQNAKAMMEQYIPEQVFYKALEPFISYGRVKYIPDEMLKHTLDYYVMKQQFDVVQKLAIFFDLKEIEKGIVIKCCLDNILVVSLANICTQGNESEFVTPFVKFWGIAEDERKRGEIVNAQYFAMRALWYVKLCLQRSMSLKTYSYEKYGYMISILTSHFFTESMIKGLLQIRTETTLESLSHYFSIENASIVNQFCKLKIPTSVNKLNWIDAREGRERLEIMLSAIYYYLEFVKDKRQTYEQRVEDQQLFYLFLSKIILFKTIKFTHEKYIEILEFLIRYYTCIRLINYGADRVEGMEDPSEEEDQIKASEYINKILILTMQEVSLTKTDINQIFEISRLASLTELQAQIKYVSGNYGQAIGIYLQGSHKAKQKVFPFIENSFKILKLENKKSQRRLLEKEVKEKISELVELNPESTTKVVKAFMPESQDELIQALSSEESLQLQYLQQLISSNSNLSEPSLLVYIELMSKLKPQNLLQVLKRLPSFPVQQSKEICKMYEVYDCLEYMYQRMGNIQESVKIAVVRISQILKNKNDEDSNSMDPYVKIAQILTNVIDVCIKNKSQEIWEQLFDSTIQLYNKEKLVAEKQNSEIDLFYEINAKILYQLLNHCSLDHCIYLIKEKYGKLDLGGRMNSAFMEVLSNYGFNENIMFSARDLNSTSLSELHVRQLEDNSRGFSVEEDCEVCGEPIDRSTKCIGFYCGHSYHKECIISPRQEREKNPGENKYCIKCLTGEENQFQLHIFQHGAGSHRTKIKTILDQILLLKENSLEKFNKQHVNYNVDKSNQEHNKIVNSKLDRMRSYEQQKQLVDETSLKVRNQLEMSKRKRKNK